MAGILLPSTRRASAHIKGSFTMMMNQVASLSAGFQIDYEVKSSTVCPEVGGLGVFTKQFIPKGGIIWRYSRGTNVLSYRTKDEVKCKLEKLDQADREFFISHAYLFDGVMNEILDDGKYWNHVSKEIL